MYQHGIGEFWFTLSMRYYYIREVKDSDGKILYNVTNDPHGKRDQRNIFRSRADAERHRGRLNGWLQMFAAGDD
ncbi:MAG: hypothetical protein QNI91_09970 [Arenicellales bacterium]|nr:hypothetical protein [Arenicellales bacterium]